MVSSQWTPKRSSSTHEGTSESDELPRLAAMWDGRVFRRAPFVTGCALALVFSVSCGPIFAPFNIPELTGIYLLESVDGSPLPQPVAPVLACPKGQMSGELHLNPGGVDYLPLYSWSICLVPGTTGDLTDFGEWNGNVNQLWLKSERGRATYPAQPSGSGGSAVTLSFLQDGHAFVFRLVRRNDAPTGVLEVSVFDETGNWVNGAQLLFLTGDGLPAGGTTNNNRALGGLGAVGAWSVTVTPPQGYVVPPAQPNPISVQVPETTSSSTVTRLTIVLQKVP